MRPHILPFLVYLSCIASTPLAFSDAPETKPQSSILFAPNDGKQDEAKTKATPEPSNAQQDITPEIKTENMNMPSYGATFAKMILTLAGLILLVILTVWLLKKLMQGKIGSFGKKHIQILERRPLSPKTVLYVIEFSGKQIVIAESQLEIKQIASTDVITENG